VTRLAVLVAVAIVVAALTWAWRRRQHAQQSHGAGRRVPAELLGPGDRTWVLFRTPFCATCGPAADRIRAFDPTATLVTVDASQRPDLVDELQISAAPTVLLARPGGQVELRLAGPRAVLGHLDTLVPQR
jgi:hypothetical protein